MSISQSLRFQILKRDGHTCRYCGAGAPEVKLHVDHVLPVALGGSDDASNLVTACVECNSGKSATPPAAKTVDDVAEDSLRWASAIRRAAQEAAAKSTEDAARKDRIINGFRKYWLRFEEAAGAPCELPPNWESSIMAMVNSGYPTSMLRRALIAAMTNERIANKDVFRYMCGIVWRQLSEIQGRAKEILAEEEEQKVG